MATVIEFPAADEVTQKALTWPDRARALAVTTPENYVEAGELLKAIKALRKEVDATFDPIISAAFAAHREACAQKKKAETPLAEAEQILKRGLITYDTEQEQLRVAEQIRRQEEARKDEERRRVEEAAALEREALANPCREEAQQQFQEAEALITAPLDAPSVIVPKSTPKVEGLSYSEKYSADPNVDIKKLCAAVASGECPTSYVLPNMVALNKRAASDKLEMRIPGVKVRVEKIARAGGR